MENVIQGYLVEMKRANEQMRLDQDEIDRLKKETEFIAAKTRVALAELEQFRLAA